MNILGVIPAANTARVLIPYRNITNICQKLIIYRHIWYYYKLLSVFCVGIMCTHENRIHIICMVLPNIIFESII